MTTRSPVGAADDTGPVPVVGESSLAENRVRFLTAEPVSQAAVRAPILASWHRSHGLGVAADRVEAPAPQTPDVDTPLTRSAEPVLQSLFANLTGQSVSIVLTDQTGVVLRRLTGDGVLERELDRVMLVPGSSYAEEFVGTNGIGTALEVGGPTHVFGHEHYAEHLEELACAGVPIHQPLTGRTVGALDLTCWRRDAGALLLTLAKTTAAQIQQAMLDSAGAADLALYREYRRTCRRTGVAVVGVTGDVVMSNDLARTSLDPKDLTALLEEAAGHIARTATSPAEPTREALELPSGASVRVHYRSVGGSATHPTGVVLQVSPSDGPARPGPRSSASRAAAREAAHVPAPPPLPGLVGRGATWLRAAQELERTVLADEWVAVAGEPGVGKAAMLAAVQLRKRPVGHPTVLDAADAAANTQWPGLLRRTLEGDAAGLVVRHVDRLDGLRLRALAAALAGARAERRQRGEPFWVAVTLAAPTDGTDLAALLRLFPTTVEVPPLRRHLDDLPELVSFFLARLGHGGALTCSPETLAVLSRASWPGNVGEVRDVLRAVVRRRRSGVVAPADLPPGVRTVTRRRLSPLESLERDAIVDGLADAGGSKVDAARSLGMSRATIYRKIHDYGITIPPKA